MARLDGKGRILDSNPAFSLLTGRSSRELRGLAGGELLTPGDSGAHSDSWAGLFSGRWARYRGRVLVVRKDHRLLYAEANAWLVRDGQQRPTEAVCSLRPVLAAEEAEFLTSAVPLHLSMLEARTLEGIAEGMTNSALCRALSLSRQGLDYHLAQLRRKLQARSRCSLVARAYALGVVAPGVWPPRVDPSAVTRPRVPRRRRPPGAAGPLPHAPAIQHDD
jgi:PAS domain S-box-containing protein